MESYKDEGEKGEDFFLGWNKYYWAGSRLLVEHLPSLCDTMSSLPSTEKISKKRERKCLQIDSGIQVTLWIYWKLLHYTL